MTLYAVISDLHANLLASEIVFRDIEKRGIEKILCLGDIIGYGAQPFECVDLVQQKCSQTVKGNHEVGWLDKVLDAELVLRSRGYSETASKALDWTADLFNQIQGQGGSRWSLFSKGEAQKKKESTAKNFDFIKKLPSDFKFQTANFNVYCVHANPLHPKNIHDYVFDPKLARKYGLEEGRYTNPGEIFAAPQLQTENIFFTGHTHERVIYVGDNSGDYKLVPQRIRISQKYAEGKRMLVNPGSVGYPRSDAKSISYALFNPEAQGKEYLVEIIVLPYWEAVSQALEKAGLDNIFKKTKNKDSE